MRFRLVLTDNAENDLQKLERTNPKKLKKVLKTLGQMEAGLQSRGLNPHPYKNRKTDEGDQVFEVYVENNTPSAYRIFWYYGPETREITILAITPHP